MSRNRFIVIAALYVCACFAVHSNTARAGIIASDAPTTVSAPYADGWQAGDNGGSGFGAWSFAGSSFDPSNSPYPTSHFIDSSSTFNDLGTAFAFTNENLQNSGATATATRPFSAAMEIGQTFSVDLDNPLYDPPNNNNAGFRVRFQNSNGGSRLSFYSAFNYLSEQWLVYDSIPDRQTGFDDVDGSGGFNLAFTLTGVDTYALTITPMGGGSPIEFTGTLINSTFKEIVSVQLQMYGNGSGSGGNSADPTGEHEFFFANMLLTDPSVVVPTPSSVVGLGGIMALALGRRRYRPRG